MNRRNLYLIALFLLFTVKPSLSQEWVKNYTSDLEAGIIFLDNSKYEEASVVLESAYEIAVKKNDSLKIVASGVQLAEAYYSTKSYEEGQELLFFIEDFITPKTPSGLVAKSKLYLGYMYNGLGDYAQSNKELLMAYNAADPQEDAYILGRITMVLANGLIRFGEYDRGLELITESIELFTSINDTYFIGSANQIKYNIYLYKGEREKAESYLFKSCKIAEELESINLLRNCYYYLSDLFKRKNDYYQSITYSQKALQIAEEQQDDFYIIRFFNDLGELYLEIKEPDRALSYFNRAHAYYVSIGNDVLAYQTLVKIAETYVEKNDYKEGEEILQQALDFFLSSEYHYDKGLALISLGELKLLTNQQEEALEYLEQAISVGKDYNLKWIQLLGQETLLKLNEEYFSNEDKLALSKEIFSFSSNLAPLYHLRGLKNLALSYSGVGSDSAFYYAELALELIEKKRLTFSGGTLKANVFSDHAEFYNLVGSWYASKKENYNRAFELFEASKSRALLDQLAETQSRDLLSLSEETQIQLLQLQKTTDQLYRQREEAQSHKEIIELTDAITDAEFKYEVALEKIRKDHPEWNSFIYPKNLSLKEVQKLCNENTAILEFAILKDGITSMLITKDEVYYHQTKTDAFFQTDFTQQINAFRDSIVTSASFEVLEETSANLYATLFQPFEGQLSEISNLIIVPDGPIALLPFDALVHEGEFLITHFAIKSLPSVSVFKLLQSPHRQTSLDILGIAGSGFEVGEGYINSRTQNSFSALPFTLLEVDSVSSKFNTSKVLKNELVTEAGLKSLDLRSFRYIHFATHGDINETTPTQSGLILSKKTEMERLFGEDGYLNAAEIASLSLNADMVVLSACNTATGKVQSGEGLLGLQRSFLTAGASSVVASLWSIYDRSTPLFMTSFYSKLIEYEKKEFGWFDKLLVWGDWYEPELVDYKTLALRDAKLEMLNHPYYSHPVHWASFVITGK